MRRSCSLPSDAARRSSLKPSGIKDAEHDAV